MNYEDFGVSGPEELEQDEWSLHGGVDGGRPTFETPKGGVLTVVGYLPKAKYTSKYYILKCSCCADDPELFGGGIFKSQKTPLIKAGGFPCGCARRVSWRPEQYDTLVKRVAEGVTIMNLGTFSSSKSTVIKSCPVHGETSGDLESFLRSGKCPRCVDRSTNYRFSPTEKEVLSHSLQTVCEGQGLELKATCLGDCYQNSSAVVACTFCGHTQTVDKSFRKFSKGQIPYLCPCRRYTSVAEKQKSTREEIVKNLSERLSRVGANLISVDYDESQPSYATTFRFACSSCGQEVVSKYRSFRGGGGRCRACSTKESSSNRKLSEEDLMRRISDFCKDKNFKFLRFTNTGKGYKRGFSLLPSCCGNAFETSLAATTYIKRDTVFCPACSAKELGRKKALSITTIKRDLRRDGYEFVEFPDGYSNTTSTVVLRCPTHGVYSAKIADVRGKFRSGCPSCAGHTAKYSYLNLLLDGDIEIALKLGVTSNIERRLHQQRMKTIYDIRHLASWVFSNRESCMASELECKQVLQTGVLSAREMQDGHTETVSVLDLEKVIAIYEKHGGIRIK